LETVLRVGGEERARAILEQLLNEVAVGDESPVHQTVDVQNVKMDFDSPCMSQLERKFEAALQQVVADDDVDDQTELASDFMRGHGDQSATMVLKKIAQDAKIGLPRAVLDTMSDIINTIVSATEQFDSTLTPSAVTSDMLDVEWDSAYVG
jgi:pyruvate dehydrogenase complex dehydrogenase (E1) component